MQRLTANNRESFLTDVKRHAAKANIPWEVIDAICQIESGYNQYAVRFEPDYKWIYKTEDHAKNQRITLITEQTLQRFSWGLMQIMGATARSDCDYIGPLHLLCEANINLHCGVKYFSKLLKRWPNILDAVAAYNAGSPRKVESTGLYINQGYVDKFLEIMKKHPQTIV